MGSAEALRASAQGSGGQVSPGGGTQPSALTTPVTTRTTDAPSVLRAGLGLGLGAGRAAGRSPYLQAEGRGLGRDSPSWPRSAGEAPSAFCPCGAAAGVDRAPSHATGASGLSREPRLTAEAPATRTSAASSIATCDMRDAANLTTSDSRVTDGGTRRCSRRPGGRATARWSREAAPNGPPRPGTPDPAPRPALAPTQRAGRSRWGGPARRRSPRCEMPLDLQPA